MKRTLILFLFLISTITGLFAKDNSDLSGSLLWKISGKNLIQPSYILGTHHLTEINFVDSISGLRTVLKNVNQVVGELLIDDKQALQMKIQQEAMMPAGETYKSLLSAEDYTKLDEALKAMFGAGLDQFQQLKPGLINLIYSVTLYAKLYPQFNPMTHQAIDEYVQIFAKENNKTVVGLESIDDQIYALINAEPLKKQAEDLICSISNTDSSKESIDLLNKYYRSGDLERMYQLAFENPKEPCPMSQAQKSAVLKERNDKWLDKLPELMENKSNLIAVGALHLAGEEGLLHQLQKMGYTVEPVK